MDLQRAGSTRSQRSVRLEEPEQSPRSKPRRLSRVDSQRENPQNKKVFEDRFETMPFADPDPKRAYPTGPLVHTEEHVLLMRRLRMEAARLSSDLAEVRNKNAILSSEKIILETRVSIKNAEIRRLVSRLEEANEALVRAQMSHEHFLRIYNTPRRGRPPSSSGSDCSNPSRRPPASDPRA